MAYQYYRSSYPGWGTSQLQFGAPPIPTFQPQPTWSGWDYYNAHAINPDPSLYYSVINRMREFAATGGVGLHDARRWHRRIYSGLVSLPQALPGDIGAAAAYEAYRMWRHHHSILYQPLGGEREREREGLVGMAVAEASHLWQYSGRPMDAYGLREALESAALTASRISYRVFDDEYSSGGFMNGRGSMGGDYSDSDYSEPQYHRHRRYSSIGSAPSMLMGAGSGVSPYGTPIPGMAGSAYGGGGGNYGGGNYGGGNYGGGNYGGVSGSYGSGYAGAPYMSGSLTPNPYGSVPGSYGCGYAGAPYMSGSLTPNPYGGFVMPPNAGYPGSYGGSPYMGGGYAQPYGNTMYPGQGSVPGGSTVIIPPSRRHRRSSSSGRHHHHHRSHSSEPLRYA